MTRIPRPHSRTLSTSANSLSSTLYTHFHQFQKKRASNTPASHAISLNSLKHANSHRELHPYAKIIENLLSQHLCPSLLHFLLLLHNDASFWIQVIPLHRLTKLQWHEHADLIRARLEQAFRIHDPVDWCRISQEQLVAQTASPLLNMDFLMEMLREWYPKHEFSPQQFHRNKRSVQRWLYVLVREIFEQYAGADATEVLEEKTLELLDEDGEPEYLQVDIYVPKYNLVVEYHGEQHYTQRTRQQLNRMERRIRNDEHRRTLFTKNDILHLEVPYWWDQSVEQLQASLHEKYPFLVEAPEDGVKSIPDIVPSLDKSSRSAVALQMENFCNDPTRDLSSFRVQEVHDGIFVHIVNEELFASQGGAKIVPPPNITQEISQLGETDAPIQGVLYSMDYTGPHRLNALLHDSNADAHAWERVRLQILFPERLSSQAISNSNFFTHKPSEAYSPAHLTLTAQEALHRNVKGYLASHPTSNTNVLLPLRNEFYALLLDKEHTGYRVQTSWGRELLVSSGASWSEQKAEPGQSVVKCIYNPMFSQSTDDPNEQAHIYSCISESWMSILATRHVSKSVDFHQLLQHAIREAGMNLDNKRYSTKVKRELIEQILTENSDVYPTPEEQKKMSEILGEDLGTIQKFLGTARSKMRHHYGEISDELKTEIDVRLAESSEMSASDLHMLSTAYNVGVKRIQTYIRRLQQEPTTTLKDSHQSILRQWIDEHDYSEVTPETLAEFASQFQVSPGTIRRYLYERSSRHGQLTPSQRAILTEWYDSHSYDNLSDDTLSELSHQCPLPPARIRAFLYAHHHKGDANLTDSQRDQLRTLISQHHLNTGEEHLRAREVQRLSQKFGVSEVKIQAFVYQYIRLTSQTLTDEQKETITAWYAKHKKHTQKQVDGLAEELHAAPARVQQFIYGLSRTGKLDAHQEEALQEWIATHHYSDLTTHELERLSQKLHVNEKRIRSFIYTANSRALNAEQKDALNTWIKHHKYSELTDQELEGLSEQTKVIKSRIRRYIKDRTPILENL